jgi:uncharacterized MnhB-related membrane protein
MTLDNAPVHNDADLLTLGRYFLQRVINCEVTNRCCGDGTVLLYMLLKAIDMALDKKISGAFGTIALLVGHSPV